MNISVIVLTFNSEDSIRATIDAAKKVSDDIYAVDSYSTDGTLGILAELGVTVSQRKFSDYSDQRNWAIENLPLKHGWQLHLDADEILSDELVAKIKEAMARGGGGVDGYFVPRLTRFLNKDLYHGGYYPNYHMRLFRTGAAFVEHRKYDQHFVLKGKGAKLEAPLIDDHRMSLSEWTARHNRWSDFEILDVMEGSQGQELRADAQGTPPERQRAKKAKYYSAPLFLRALGLFLYRYLFKMGFLDGTPGLIYCFLQSFWFRFLVDAKIYERRMRAKERPVG
jgi:glycosyltransferase involved in cell wall biosynthesis